MQSNTPTHSPPGSEAARTAPKSTRGEMIWGVAILAAVVANYFYTFGYFWEKWDENAQYSLAYLVPFVSGYFVWKKWPELRKIKRDASPWGLALMAFGLILHIIGDLLDISGPSSVSLVLCIVGGCLYFHSLELVRALGFPLAYLVFAVPIPGGAVDLIAAPMQLWASAATEQILVLAGIDVTRSGVTMSVPGFEFEVARGCSGLNSLVALVGVTAVFAYLARLKPLFKWILFAFALPIALGANVVRIVTIALVGYEWGPDVASDLYHDWSSPMLFMVAIVFMFLVNWGLEWVERRTTS